MEQFCNFLKLRNDKVVKLTVTFFVFFLGFFFLGGGLAFVAHWVGFCRGGLCLGGFCRGGFRHDSVCVFLMKSYSEYNSLCVYFLILSRHKYCQ